MRDLFTGRPIRVKVVELVKGFVFSCCCYVLRLIGDVCFDVVQCSNPSADERRKKIV